MKNRLTDLNDHLFEQLERLSSETLDGAALVQEVERAAAIVQVADKIVANAKLQLDACKFVAENAEFSKRLPMIAPVVVEKSA